MPGIRHTSLAVVCVSAVAVPALVLTSPSQSAQPPSSQPSSTSASTASTSSGASSASGSADSSAPNVPAGRISVDKSFAMSLDSHGTADPSKLPTASTLFTQKELTQVIPGLKSVDVNDETENLTIGSDQSSALQIVLKRFGTKDSVTAAWKKEKAAHERRSAQNPGLYTFFENRLGATDAFTDGTNTHVLVTAGNAAGEIWFSGTGFTTLSGNYSSSRTDYTKRVVPSLVRLIADKAAQGAAEQATKPPAPKTT